MACVTLKRPLEWVDPSMSPEHGHGHMGSGSPGSPTSMIISNSPPHHMGSSSCSFSPAVPNKRACLGSGVHASSSFYHGNSSTSTSSLFGTSGNSSLTSPFKVNNKQGGDIAEQIREEMLRLKMVRSRFASVQKNHQQTSGSSATSTASNTSSSSTSGAATSTSTASASAAGQPSATLLSVREIFLKAAQNRNNHSSHHNHHQQNQPILFTLDEVVPIVERLLAEQEDHLRLLLQERLAEQYDQFRRFTADQLLVQAKTRALEESSQESSMVSYLS